MRQIRILIFRLFQLPISPTFCGQYILELMNKEIFTILHSKFCLSKPMILLKRLDVINYTTHIEMVSFDLMSISTSIYQLSHKKVRKCLFLFFLHEQTIDQNMPCICITFGWYTVSDLIMRPSQGDTCSLVPLK